MSRLLTPLALLLGLSLASMASQAEARPLTASTRALGLSNAIHAISSGTMAPGGNPAGMSTVFQYMIEGSYGFVHDTNDSRAAIAVMDSSTNQSFALGGSYVYQGGAASGDPDGHLHQVSAGASSGYVAGNVGFYLGGMYHYQNDALGSAHDGSIGAIMGVQRMLTVGVVGHNLFNPEPTRGKPRALSSGVSVGREQFLLAFDNTVDFDSREEPTMIYRGAAEVFLAGVVALRAGYAFDRVRDDRHSISAGFGLVFKLAGLEFGYEQNPQVGRDNLFMGSVVLYVP